MFSCWYIVFVSSLFVSHLIFFRCLGKAVGSGWMRQWFPASCVTGASNRYWLTVGQGMLFLQQVRVEGDVFISSVSSLSFIFLLLPCPFLSSPLLSLLSLFSLSLGNDTKWPTRVDGSLNPNTIDQSIGKAVFRDCVTFWVSSFIFDVWNSNSKDTHHRLHRTLFVLPQYDNVIYTTPPPPAPSHSIQMPKFP